MRRIWHVGVALAGGVLVSWAGAPVRTAEINVPTLLPREKLETILERFDQTQEGTDTLIAAFTETKKLQMLRTPVLSSGYFYYSKPNRVKWEYREPESKIYLITEDRYLAYYPDQKRAEKVNIQRYSAKLFRAFGIGQTTAELKKYYDIRLVETSDLEDTFLLDLSPKKRRIRKRIEILKIWVNDQSFLPVQMAYIEPDGDSTLLRFDRVLINPEIRESRYQVSLPSDVTVTDSFSGIGSIGQQTF